MKTQSEVAMVVLTALVAAGWVIIGTDVEPAPTPDAAVELLRAVNDLTVYVRHPQHGRSFVWFIWQGPDVPSPEADEILADYGCKLDDVLTMALGA